LIEERHRRECDPISDITESKNLPKSRFADPSFSLQQTPSNGIYSIDMNILASLFNLAGPDLIVILLIVLLLFGSKKLPELARGMGQAVKEFNKAKEEIERELTRPNTTEVVVQPANGQQARQELPPVAPAIPVAPVPPPVVMQTIPQVPPVAQVPPIGHSVAPAQAEQVYPNGQA
jgi:sec-independent protein translocase protein TatA